jgi:hypothetical protein
MKRRKKHTPREQKVPPLDPFKQKRPSLALPPDIIDGPPAPSRADRIPTSDGVDARGNKPKRCMVKVEGI